MKWLLREKRLRMKRSAAALLAILMLLQAIPLTSFGAVEGLGPVGPDQMTNGSFEETSQAESGNLNSFWKDGIYPAGWDRIWDASGGSVGKIQLSIDDTVAYHGEKSVHIKSTDNSKRMEFLKHADGIDLTRDYFCTLMVKAENVIGNGFYMRIGVTKTGSGTVGTYMAKDQQKITGTTEGWVPFIVHIKDAPAGADGIQFDLFTECLTGDLWIDDVRLVSTYRFSLSESRLDLTADENRVLTPVFDERPEDIMIQWSSTNPDVAAVDEAGNITAVRPGTAVIKAVIDEYHFAECSVMVTDGNLRGQYKQIRDKWRDRLTGNQVQSDADPAWQQAVDTIENNAKAAWEGMIKKPAGADSRTTLWGDLDLTIRYQAGNSNSSLSEPFSTAFTRVEQMALAYASNRSAYYQNEELKADIIDALTWLHANVYNEDYNVSQRLYGNWYHWEIGMPQSLANTVILMYDQLPPELIQKEAATLANFNENPNYVYKIAGWGKMDMTSANLMDTCLVSVLRSAIAEDAAAITMANAACSKVLPYATAGDGFYVDGSCIQHTNLAYTGGYGATLLNGINKLFFLTDDSTWAIEDEQAANVYDWILEGYRPLFADGAIMDMVSGRSIARPSRSDQTAGKGILIPVVHLYQTAPEDKKEQIGIFAREQLLAGIAYNENYFDSMSIDNIAAIKGFLNEFPAPPADQEQSYHKVFGAMDKVVHHSDKFSLGISMYSKRMGSFEYGNGENLKGYHTADGALYLYNKDQGQYADSYWPTVDPMRLAGITTDHSEGTISSTWSAHVSSKDWVGGSSVFGKYGSTGMDFEAENSSLTGKKSWFSFDDEVVALGTGISSASGRPVETIVENRKISDDRSNRLLANGVEAGTTEGVKEAQTDTEWAWLEGNAADGDIGYYFPGKADIQMMKEARTGSWRDINSAVAAGAPAAEPITKMYASLAIDHGTDPSAEQYSYVLLPGKSEVETAEYAGQPDIEVLANRPAVQAVREKTLGVTGMNFWEPAILNQYEAKTPASVTAHENKNILTLGISNPTQNGQKTVLKLAGTYRVVAKDSTVTATMGTDGLDIRVETVNDYGKTHTLTLEVVDPAEFNLLYERIYKQSTGFAPGQSLPEGSNYVDAFISKLDQESAGYWSIMNKKDDTGRDEIFQGIKPKLQGGPNENSAELTTTYKYLNKLVQAYYTEGTTLYRQEGLLEEVLSAADFTIANGWFGRNTPTNSAGVTYYGNWWDHRIGVPAQFLPMLTMLQGEAELTRARYETYMDAMKYQKAHDWSGYNSANLADIGLNAMYIAILEKDSDLLNRMKVRFGDELFDYTKATNGWYPDGSYIDHSKYAYTGGYGSVLVSAMSRILPVLSGTDYEMSFDDERDDFYREIIFKGYLPLHSAGTLNDSVRGRSITRETAQRSTSAGHLAVFAQALPEEEGLLLKAVIKGWLEADPDIMKYLTRPGELIACQEILADPSIEAKKHPNGFYAYNYMNKAVQHTDDYMVAVSMHSNTIANYEYGNTEGKKLWNISDGALFLHNGDLEQYRDGYWPTVDHLRLPGTTTMHKSNRAATAGAGTFNPNTWVSGIGFDGIGNAGIQIKTLGEGARDGAFAKKSYFMFDDEIVAVGSDIKNLSSNLEYPIETVVENRKINNDLSNTLLVDGAAVDTALLEDAAWAHLEGDQADHSIGYVFPRPTEIHVRKEERTGFWQDINGLPGMRTSDDPVTRGYATIYIDHGTRPDAADYEYILLPGRTAEETEAYQVDPDVVILDNSISVHSAYEKNLRVTAANFWTSRETSAADGKLTASRFATILLKENDDSFELLVADPIHSTNGKIRVKVALPAGEMIEMDEKIEIVSEGAVLVLDIDVSGAAKDQVFYAKFENADDQEDTNDEMLDELYEAAAEITSIADGELAAELLERINEIEAAGFTPEQKERFSQLKDLVKGLIKDIEIVKTLLAAIEEISEIDEENEAIAEKLLIKYQKLTERQKGLIPPEDKAMVIDLEQRLNDWKGRSYVTAIHLKKAPDKTEYLAGEELDTTGMIITADYNDRDDVPVYTWTLSGYDKEQIGEQEITISFEALNIDGETEIFTVSFMVTVTEQEKPEPEKPKPERPSGGSSVIVKKRRKVMPEAQLPLFAYPAAIGDPAGWIHDGIGWRMNQPERPQVSNEWRQVNGKWYFFEPDGYMAVGWRKLDFGQWYYLGEDGAMATGWIFHNGAWYYLQANGAMMLESLSIDGKIYVFDSSGACVNPY